MPVRGINGMPSEDWMQYSQHYIAQNSAVNQDPRRAKVAAHAAPAATAAHGCPSPLLGMNGMPLVTEADWMNYTQQYMQYMQQDAGAGKRALVQVPAPAPAASAAREAPAPTKKGWFW